MSSPTDTDGSSHLLEVGRIVKPHGLRGQVIVEFISERPERRVPGAVFTTDRGSLTLGAIAPHQKRWICTFTGTSDRNAADALHGLTLYAEALEPLDDEVYVQDVAGKRLIDAAGTDRGEIVGLEANPAADLLVLDDGRVIPLTFVADIGEHSVTLDEPPGLFDL